MCYNKNVLARQPGAIAFYTQWHTGTYNRITLYVESLCCVSRRVLRGQVYRTTKAFGVKGWTMISDKLRVRLLFQQQGRCYVCGIEEWRTKARLDTHRILPGKLGGEYADGNIILVCRKCHHNIEGLPLDEIEARRETHQ